MNIYYEERECVTKDHLHQEEQETLNSKDIEIAARELPTHLGGGVRGNYDTFDGRVLSLLKDVNEQCTAIT